MDRKFLIACILFIFCAFGFIDLVSANTQNFCQNEYTEKEWKLIAKKNLAAKLESYQLDRKNESILNAMITESYSDLMDESESLNELNLIGYFYSHASFHLGRIARYRYWDRDDEVGNADKELITGRRLRGILKINSSFASKKLMYYSEQLYYHLSWSLIAMKLCGKNYVLERINNKDLKDFYESSRIEEKLKSFVRFEQTYLQKTLYRDRWVAPMVRLGTIDEMRWIPFANELSENFKQWCQRRGCRKTSFDLESRINFDTETLLREWNFLLNYGLENRLSQSPIFAVNNYFIELMKGR